MGSAGVALGADEEPLGATSAVPIAATAKILTALLVLDEHPLEAGRSGPAVPVTAQDFAAYQRYSAEGTRSVRVVAGDTWTEREALQAMLLASSNNHAEMLARWAYGSLDGYLAAAEAWLTEHGMTTVHVVDPTGLSPESVGSGADLARLSALALADPFLSETLSLDLVTTTRGATFQNDIRYRTTDGIISVSRSYTDEAGVCLLFAVPVEVGDETIRVYGSFLGEPSYDDLDTDLDAFLASVPASITAHVLVEPGAPVARYETAWGATANAVVRDELRGTDWGGRSAPVAAKTREVTTAGRGTRVGTATIETREGAQTSAVVLDHALADPGPLWRLFTPSVVVPRFVDWVTGKS
ncbi:hypothetical protein [Naasia aerilata]|uniref:Peptidase S11 D-alanyl-D-alanine carboxypeptidase A N-terminal domain-containing protein n=1 Tax=Naasia aerilata TaxID=1162966 RepID=A0ABM8GDU8_9MICO|nr:hypothetical protein [Naasia aerilata]BDZ46463.1 hypothetical protein GCM10025866_23720 [Naasia aerilata]